jgi:hypothetical protein
MRVFNSSFFYFSLKGSVVNACIRNWQEMKVEVGLVGVALGYSTWRNKSLLSNVPTGLVS